jgi:FkbM family methyltransferase
VNPYRYHPHSTILRSIGEFMTEFRESLSRRPWLRRTTLGLLRFLERDITIRNSWSGEEVRLELYRHKGYWYYGASRERETMEAFRHLVRPGDTVVEVGGHIGYITQYFSKLVGATGHVVVFEPGINNQRYIEANVLRFQNVTLERVAVAFNDGNAVLYEDTITGQNNSLNPSYYYVDDAAASHGVSVERIPHEVPTVALDSYVSSHGIRPDFLKIDVESLELAVLRGALHTLQMIRGLMVEITDNKKEVITLLREAGFSLVHQPGGNTIGLRDQRSVAVC